ncbi:LLM class F420-dependent oxidoreductase [Frankia sp. AiPs1]|uniref:LLM class F420-dependent oxidoreductase n=1 Tax=Frankia sp. AiPs1 TaxID=573493 RepID=UPI0020430095|nr:LLM class F420-dependent oxidoreductase [Frankia sp. AiPs1]MCM3921844.1 LLM class F420-dependent oxidoreductase [Frankia sp. AiPs1]
MKYVAELVLDAGCRPGAFSARRLTRLARRIEEAGYDAIAVNDHLAPSRKWYEAGGHDAYEPFGLMAFLAAVTERVRLMTFAVVVPHRNPFALAKSVATTDALSDGRLDLGVAVGYLRSEFLALGADFDERNELFDEALAVLRGAWTAGSVSARGRHFDGLDQVLAPAPVQLPHPPLWIAGNSARARRRAAAWGQGWAPLSIDDLGARTIRSVSIPTVDDLRRAARTLRADTVVAGRDPAEVGLWATTSDSAAAGRDGLDARAHLEHLVELADLGASHFTATFHLDDTDGAERAIDGYAEHVLAAAGLPR